MSRIVGMCPLTKSGGGLQLFHDVGDNTCNWLEITVNAALENEITVCELVHQQMTVTCYMVRPFNFGLSVAGFDKKRESST